jgi:plastocyanin domain-containing protein
MMRTASALALLLAACGGQTAEEGPAPEAAAIPVPARVEGGVQVAEVTVDGSAFDPAAVLLRPGLPARLVFTRTAAPTCADTVKAPALGVAPTALPVGEAVAVEFTPGAAGTSTFTCGMDMTSGRIVVQS